MAAPFRIDEMVSTVVMPSEMRAGVASIEIQKETYNLSRKLQTKNWKF